MSDVSNLWVLDNQPHVLRDVVRRHNLTLKEVSGLVKKSPRTVSYWLSGERRIPYADWFTLLTKLGEMD